MKKFKLMLMFCALVSLTGLAPAEVTLVEWDYFQDTIATNTGTLSDIYVLPDLVNGIVGVDPNLILTATLPAPGLTQNETGIAIPGNAVGYAIIGEDPNTNPWGPGFDFCGGFTLQWSGTVLYSGTVNYDGGDPEVWALPLPLKFHSNRRDDPYRSTQFFWDVNIFDDGGNDFVGKFRTASKWGDGCDGSRHSGDQQNWYLPNYDPNTAFEDHDGFMGRAADGDDMGFTFYRRDGEEPEGSGVIFVDDLYIGGTLFVDLSELGELPCPAFAVGTGDLDGDCIVNLRDFALLAATWQDCGWDYDCPP